MDDELEAAELSADEIREAQHAAMWGDDHKDIIIEVRYPDYEALGYIEDALNVLRLYRDNLLREIEGPFSQHGDWRLRRWLNVGMDVQLLESVQRSLKGRVEK